MKKLLLSFTGLALVLPVAAFAAYLKTGDSVSLNSAETLENNVYVAAGSVTVPSVIKGDLLAAGGTLLISGRVNRDIFAVGGTINIIGGSAEDARIVGGNIMISGVFGGEVMVAGGQVLVTPDATIAKDSYFAGGNLNFEGNAAGNLHLYGGNVYINGVIGKNLVVRAEKITIGPNAVIKGNIDYSAYSEAAIEAGAQIIGTKTFHRIENVAEGKAAVKALFPIALFGFMTFWWMAKVVMVLVAAYLVWFFFKQETEKILADVLSHFGKALLRGFVFAVVAPVAVIIALVSVVGIIPAIIAALLYSAIIILSTPLAGLLTVSLLIKGQVHLKWYHVILGVAVISVAHYIPFIGWIACLIVYLASLGGLINFLKLIIQRER